MKFVKVIFENKEHNFTTKINGSVEEIREYYIGNTFHINGKPEIVKTIQFKVEVIKGSFTSMVGYSTLKKNTMGLVYVHDNVNMNACATVMSQLKVLETE